MVKFSLVSLLAVVAIHYGGAIIFQAVARANATVLLNDAQQIGGVAIAASMDDPYRPLSQASLQDELPARPGAAEAGAAWQIDPSGVLAYVRLSRNAAPKVCSQLAAMGGLDVAGSWSGPASGLAALHAANTLFGCVGDGAATPYFAYRIAN